MSKERLTRAETNLRRLNVAYMQACNGFGLNTLMSVVCEDKDQPPEVAKLSGAVLTTSRKPPLSAFVAVIQQALVKLRETYPELSEEQLVAFVAGCRAEVARRSEHEG